MVGVVGVIVGVVGKTKPGWPKFAKAWDADPTSALSKAAAMSAVFAEGAPHAFALVLQMGRLGSVHLSTQDPVLVDQ